MIRDPSDGSVREKEDTSVLRAPADPLFEQIKSALLAGKVRPERVSDKWEYQRAWNDAVDFSIRQAEQVFKQKG
jgi:hypothetical protein